MFVYIPLSFILLLILQWSLLSISLLNQKSETVGINLLSSIHCLLLEEETQIVSIHLKLLVSLSFFFSCNGYTEVVLEQDHYNFLNANIYSTGFYIKQFPESLGNVNSVVCDVMSIMTSKDPVFYSV